MPDILEKRVTSILKLVARLKARGVTEVGRVGIRRAREWVSSSEELIILSRPAGGPAPILEELSFREATAIDGDRYAADIGTDSAATFRARLSEATRCFVVESGGRFVHATWMTTAAAWAREIGAYLQPPSGHAYVYESFTRAEVRGRGVYPFALRSIAAWLTETQAHTVWVAIEASNSASARAVAKAGFEPRFTIDYQRRLGRLRVKASSRRDERDLPELMNPPTKRSEVLHYLKSWK